MFVPFYILSLHDANALYLKLGLQPPHESEGGAMNYPSTIARSHDLKMPTGSRHGLAPRMDVAKPSFLFVSATSGTPTSMA